MQIGRLIAIDGEETALEIDDDFLEFLVDAIRGEKKVKKDKPSYPSDWELGWKSIIRFGKYRGKTWEQVKKEDPTYIDWAVDNVERIPEWFKKLLTGEDTGEF